MLSSQGRPMKKVIFFSAVGLAVVGVLFVLAGSRTQKPPLANIPVRTVLPNARPLVWLDERFLLTAFSVLSGVRPMTEVFPLERAAEAYKRMMSGKARFRVVLTTG